VPIHRPQQGQPSPGQVRAGDTTPQQAVSADASRPELLLDRYHVVETRGTGGFGCVLVCWDTRLQRRVAIKRMPLAQPDPYAASAMPSGASSLEEVLSEARTASMLSHPNIVTVLDLEVEGSFAYLVMEYVDGITLAELLGRVEGGVLTYDECAHVLSSLASALSFAHENGVLHLDIKPANVFIDRSGTVKLGDFGMAALASAAGFGGARGGTVGYMPPEQLAGSTVDERCDIYSLAVVCYEALTGRDPFAAPSAEESEELEAVGAPPLSEDEPGLEGPVSDAIACALDPSPQGRMAQVSQLAREVVPSLGDPVAGQSSIASLMAQVTDDESYEEGWHEFEREPLSARMPWLPKAFSRVMAAATCAWCAYLLTPGLGFAGSVVLGGQVIPTPLVAALLCAVAAALVPWLGCALVLVGLTGAVGMSGSQAVGYAVALGGVCLVWWVLAGRRHELAGAAALLPACLGVPVAGVGLGGWALPPLGALVTGAFGYLVQQVMTLCTSSGFDGAATASGLSTFLSTPSSWVLAIGYGLCSLLVSAVCRRRTMTSAIVAQVLGGCALVFVGMVAARVENGSIWLAPSWGSVASAVLFSLLMVIVTVLLGPPSIARESD
jgi:serine/threonine-protein kinase